MIRSKGGWPGDPATPKTPVAHDAEDVERLAKGVDLPTLVATLRDLGVVPVGLRGALPLLHEAAREAGLGLLAVPGVERTVAAAPPEEPVREPEPAAAEPAPPEEAPAPEVEPRRRHPHRRPRAKSRRPHHRCRRRRRPRSPSPSRCVPASR